MQQRQETSEASSNEVERVGWWLGALAPMLMLIGFFAVDEGGTELSGSTSEIVDQLASSQWRIVIGNVIGILGAFVLLGFVASLRSHISTTVVGAWLGSLAFGSGVVMAIGAIIQGSFRLALRAIVESDVPPDEMLPLWQLDTVSAPLVWGATGLVAAMCVAIIAVGLLPQPFAWIGAVLVAVTIALTPTDHGGVSLTLLLWLTAASAGLLARPVPQPAERRVREPS